MNQRQKSIEKIQKAYEGFKLGFQKGAEGCVYFDRQTKSCYAVGILVSKKDLTSSGEGFTTRNLKDGESWFDFEGPIDHVMFQNEIKEYKGLTLRELITLQNLHDKVVTSYNMNLDKPDLKRYFDRIAKFEEYLYNSK